MKTHYQNQTPIKQWAEDDRPREKFLLKGKSALSDAEVLAIIIGSGTTQSSALDLAKVLLKESDNNLINLSRLNIQDLQKVNGIGPAKAINICASFELGRRRNNAQPHDRVKITSSREAYDSMRGIFIDKIYEEFWIVLLNRANHIIKKVNISEGGISGTVADPKKIFSIALSHHASSILLFHNHPSGNLLPSESDVKLTQKLSRAGDTLDIKVLDHLIVTDKGFYSFLDENKL